VRPHRGPTVSLPARARIGNSPHSPRSHPAVDAPAAPRPPSPKTRTGLRPILETLDTAPAPSRVPQRGCTPPKMTVGNAGNFIRSFFVGKNARCKYANVPDGIRWIYAGRAEGPGQPRLGCGGGKGWRMGRDCGRVLERRGSCRNRGHWEGGPVEVTPTVTGYYAVCLGGFLCHITLLS
jgi:hypothetical protein